MIAVAHDNFYKLGVKAIREFGNNGAIIYDLKYIFPRDECDLRM